MLTDRCRRRLVGVHPDLVRVVERAAAYGPPFVVTEGVRTAARQAELVREGASRTKASRHLGGFAVDLAALDEGQPTWVEPLYYPLAEAMREASAWASTPVRWGGCWEELAGLGDVRRAVQDYVARCRAEKRKPLLDLVHFELPARLWPDGRRRR